MLTIKLLLSVVLVFFAVVALFVGAWDWNRLVGALFFVALALLTWTMHFPGRVRSMLYGMLLIGTGCGFLYGAVLVWNGTFVFPLDCSRRVLGCYMWNAWYAVGGTALMGGLFALIGITGLVIGRLFIAGKARWRPVE